MEDNVFDSSTRITSMTVIEWCPQCETMVLLIDRDTCAALRAAQCRCGLLACPNCGCPPDVSAGLTAEDWEQLLTAPAEPLAEATWQDLLTQVDQLGQEVV